jgi:hypothetical protein
MMPAKLDEEFGPLFRQYRADYGVWPGKRKALNVMLYVRRQKLADHLAQAEREHPGHPEWMGSTLCAQMTLLSAEMAIITWELANLGGPV